MREIVRELVDAVHGLKGITDNRRSELHAQLDHAAGTEKFQDEAPAVQDAPADGPAGA